MKNDKKDPCRPQEFNGGDKAGESQNGDFGHAGAGRPPYADPASHSGEESQMVTASSEALHAPKRSRENASADPRCGGPLLKTNQAATYLAISPRQVQYLSKRGQLPCIQIGKSTRYTTADLDAFVGRHRRSGGQG